MTELRILRWGVRFSGWVQCNHKGLYKREAGKLESARGNVRMEAEGRRDRLEDPELLALKMEEGVTVQTCRKPLEAGRGKGIDHSLESEGTPP